MTIVTRTVASVLAAAAITAFGAGVASAAPPAAAPGSITSSVSSTSGSSRSIESNSSLSGPGAERGQLAADAARTKIDGGFCYGCAGPNSFDSAGLTFWAWAQAGYSIPRASSAQGSLPSVPRDQLQPGDLVTCSAPGQPASQVAIYVGNASVVSAVAQKGIVCVPVDAFGPHPIGHRVAL